MNAMILRRLVWKEFRTTIALWLAMVGLCFFLQMAVVTQYRALHWISLPPERITDWLFGIALFITGLYGLACAGMQYALEHENKTFGLLRSLPLTARQVAAAKTGWTIATTLTLAPVLCVMAFLFSGNGLTPEAAKGMAAAFGMFALQAIAWGTLFSLLTSRPMVAVLGAGAAVTVCITTAMSLFNDPGHSLMLLLVILAVVAATDVWIARRWFDHWKVGRKRLPIAESLAEGLGGAWRMPFRSRRGEFVGLCLHHARQSRAILGLGIFIVFIWFVGRLLVVAEVLPKNSGCYAIAALSLVLAVLLYPSLAFHGDQRQRGYRFLSHRGVTPCKAWWSRQLVWAGTYVLLTGVFLLSFAMELSLKDMPLRQLWTDLRTNPDAADTVLTFLAFWVFAYACGALVSILLRSGILAVALGAMLTIVFLIFSASFGRYAGWWPVWLIPLGLLLASRLHAADWLAERRSWRSRLRWMTPAVVPLFVLLAMTPYLRIHQIPDVPDPGFSPSQLEAEAYSPEGVARLAELVAIAGLPKETVALDEPLEWRDGKKSYEVLSAEAVKRLVAFTADWPKPAPYLEPIWMDSWASLADTDAGRRYAGPQQLVVNVMNSLATTVHHYERTGRPREALDGRIALARLGIGTALPHFVPSGLSGMRGWARSPGVNHEMLKEAISRLDELKPGRLDYALGIQLQYLTVQRAITDDEYVSRFDEPIPTGRILLPVLYPWERTRAERHLRYVVRQVMDRVEVLTASFADPHAPPVEMPPNSLYWQPVGCDTERLHDSRPAVSRAKEHAALEQMLVGTGASDFLWGSQVHAIDGFEFARRYAQIELAVEAWRLEHDGKLPDSLDQLVGVYLKHRPTHPVTKTPFRLEPGTAETHGEYTITVDSPPRE